MKWVVKLRGSGPQAFSSHRRTATLDEQLFGLQLRDQDSFEKCSRRPTAKMKKSFSARRVPRKIGQDDDEDETTQGSIERPGMCPHFNLPQRARLSDVAL